MNNQHTSDLIQQGDQFFDRGDYQKAITCFEQAVALARVLGEDHNELLGLSNLPSAWANMGDHQKEIEAATRLLARARQLKREDYEMQAALRLAEAIGSIDLRGRWHELKPLLLEGLATALRLGDHWYEVYHLEVLGYYSVKVGEEEQGFTWLQEALNAIQPDMGKFQNYFRGEVYSALSELMRKRGEHTEAVRYAEMAVGAKQNYGKPKFFATAQLRLAEAERVSGERAEALRLVNEVLALARQMRWQGVEQRAEYLRGELERELGHPDVAEAPSKQALLLAQEMKLKEEEVKCLLSLGQVLMALSRKDEACEVLAQARRLSQEREYEDLFKKAESLIREVTTGSR